MRLVDSCGWLEFFTDGPLAEVYSREVSGNPQEILIPTVVLHEVYKFLLRNAGEETAVLCLGQMSACRVEDLDQVLALQSADLAIKHKLAFADSIVLATALHFGAEVVTSDADLEGLPSVRFLPKKR